MTLLGAGSEAAWEEEDEEEEDDDDDGDDEAEGVGIVGDIAVTSDGTLERRIVSISTFP